MVKHVRKNQRRHLLKNGGSILFPLRKKNRIGCDIFYNKPRSNSLLSIHSRFFFLTKGVFLYDEFRQTNHRFSFHETEAVFACMVNLFPTQNVVQFLKNKHKTRLN